MTPGRPRPRRRPCPQGHRRQGEHLLDRLVELADAREPCREGDLSGAESGRLEKDPRRLRALGSRKGERPSPDLRHEQPVQMALAVAEGPGQPRHSFPIGHTVSNKAHGAPHDVGPAVPFGRAGRCVRQAALTGTKSRLLRCSGSREKTNPCPTGRR